MKIKKNRNGLIMRRVYNPFWSVKSVRSAFYFGCGLATSGI